MDRGLGWEVSWIKMIIQRKRIDGWLGKVVGVWPEYELDGGGLGSSGQSKMWLERTLLNWGGGC